MGQPVLSLERVSKKFCRSLKRSLFYGLQDLASAMTIRRGERDSLRRDEFWALKDVSFEIRQGETLGLVGHNGAGKSTLLKLINGLIRPDTGRVSIRGRVGALIELGAGFHPLLTGRENIYINAAILGLNRADVDRRLDEIIEFAEIGEFINSPVQSYSSGMKVRLGFSIATHLNPDILLIDEILSVGDASFRQRCLDRLGDYKRGGGTAIFISHNSTTVEKICDRAMLLDHGRVVAVGEPSDVLQRYETQALELSRKADLRGLRRGAAGDSGGIRITAVKYRDANGVETDSFDFGESFEIHLHYELDDDVQRPYFVIGLQKGERLNPITAVMNMMWDDVQLEHLPRRGVVACLVKDPSFSPGIYHLSVGIQATASVLMGQKWYLPSREIGAFTIRPGRLKDTLPGAVSANLVSHMPPVIVEHSWRVSGTPLSVGESYVALAGAEGRVPAALADAASDRDKPA